MSAYMTMHGHFGGPIEVDSDEEASPGSTMLAVAACPSKGGASNPDAVETQTYELSTQLLANAMLGLDQIVPSPGRTFAEDKTMVLSPRSVDVKSPGALPTTSVDSEQTPSPRVVRKSPDALPTATVDPEQTPSPRGTVPVEITPMKEYPTRDDQLQCKTRKEAKKKADQAANKLAKEAKEASRGRGRGRGGRGRGRGQKPTPEVDDGADGDETEAPEKTDETEMPDKIEDIQSKKKPGRPKKAQREPSESEEVAAKAKKARNCEPSETKSKAGRSKKEADAEVAVSKSKKRKQGDAPQEVAVPAARVRGKTSAAKQSEPSPKKTLSGNEWPWTFARRYRPPQANFTQRFWEGCVCAYRNVLLPHLLPGTATATQAWGSK